MLELTPEQEQIRKMTRDFMEQEVAPNLLEWQEKRYFPKETFCKMGELGLAGMLCPEQYGGSGLDRVTTAMVAEEVGRVDRSTGFIFIHNMVLYMFHKYGTEAQRERWVRPAAQGEKLLQFALTEPEAGSDAGSIRTRAVKEGNYYIVDGRKCFISNADNADALSVALKTDPAGAHRGISILVIEQGTPGFIVTKVEKTMGFWSNHICEIVFDNCRVPADNLLGESENKGFRMLMDALDGGRVNVSGLSVGLAQGAYEIALEYAKERIAFGQPISEFQAIQFMLADMATEIEAARQLVYRAARAKESGVEAAKYASMAKRFTSDTAMKVTTDAVQILGGYGYMQDYRVERFMRDAKANQIVEGTNQIHRSIIARQILK